jgi:hypothetical protein
MFGMNGANAWENAPTTSWSLTISSVNMTTSGAGLKGYEVHGTLTAALLPLSGTNVGPVTVAATF